MSRALLLALPLLAACADAPMTRAEALEALSQTLRSGQGIDATSDAIAISTDFTLGQAVADAADQLAAFWESQAPCTVVTVAGNVLTADWGDEADACLWNGKAYSGITELTVTAAEVGQVQVDHTWTGFSDGVVAVDGGATVVWDGQALTRAVTTAHTWSDRETGETVAVTGDHRMGTLDGASFFDGGITLEGDRQWTTETGDAWDLTFTGVEARWLDPAPQAGTFVVTSPVGKTLTLAFSRVDDTTIEAALTGTLRPLVFHIGAFGQIEEP